MNENTSHLEAHDENELHSSLSPTKYSIPSLTTSTSLINKCCVDSRSSSSRSNSPDHVVPSKDGCSPSYCVSTVSSSSSPQTDGSITHNFRRFFRGDYNLGTDSSPDITSPILNTNVPSPIPSSVGAVLSKCKTTAQKRRPQKKKRWTRKTAPARGGKKSSKDSSDSDYVMRCICKLNDILGEQIQCDKCEVWQHFSCMGIDRAAIPDNYLCEECDPLIFRALTSDEARKLREAFLQEHSKNKKARKKPGQTQAPRRSRPDATIPVSSAQADLMQMELSNHGSDIIQQQKHSSEEQFSRDDRKILQYEMMFKRIEERNDRKVKRRRQQTDDSSTGSPPRTIINQISEVKTILSPTLPFFNAPLEPLFLDATASTNTGCDLTPGEKHDRKNCRGKRVKHSIESSIQKTDADSGPESARSSARLKKLGNNKPELTEPTNSRIALNMKKKKSGEDADDTSELITSPLIKPFSRPVNLIDTYYSAMADVQLETENQKCERRERAFSVSESYEHVKSKQERGRLYSMYGLKKAVCSRFLEENSNSEPAASFTNSEKFNSSFSISETPGKELTPFKPITKLDISLHADNCSGSNQFNTVSSIIEENVKQMTERKINSEDSKSSSSRILSPQMQITNSIMQSTVSGPKAAQKITDICRPSVIRSPPKLEGANIPPLEKRDDLPSAMVTLSPHDSTKVSEDQTELASSEKSAASPKSAYIKLEEEPTYSIKAESLDNTPAKVSQVEYRRRRLASFPSTESISSIESDKSPSKNEPKPPSSPDNHSGSTLSALTVIPARPSDRQCVSNSDSPSHNYHHRRPPHRRSPPVQTQTQYRNPRQWRPKYHGSSSGPPNRSKDHSRSSSSRSRQ